MVVGYTPGLKKGDARLPRARYLARLPMFGVSVAGRMRAGTGVMGFRVESCVLRHSQSRTVGLNWKKGHCGRRFPQRADLLSVHIFGHFRRPHRSPAASTVCPKTARASRPWGPFFFRTTWFVFFPRLGYCRCAVKQRLFVDGALPAS